MRKSRRPSLFQGRDGDASSLYLGTCRLAVDQHEVEFSSRGQCELEWLPKNSTIECHDGDMLVFDSTRGTQAGLQG